MKKVSIVIAVVMVLSIVLSACTTQTTGETEKTVIEFWTTDNEEERILAYEMVADAFMAAHPEIDLRIVAIEEAGVAQRIATAQAANRLPDIVRMGVERVSSFAADGILDLDAAQATIESIGVDDFQAGPLAMVTDPETGKYAAVPFDGWVQALWYRSDIFDELGLAAPISWDDIDAACDTLAGNNDLVYSMTLGTDPGQNYPQQVFEQVAISNNAWPFDASGNVTMNSPEMIEALDWYAGLQRCAMPGPQYWRGARESYELGQTGMMWYSTYIMDDLVDGSGMEDGGMVEVVQDLAANSGFAPSIESEKGSATYGQLVTLGILQGADPMAQEVVKFFMTGQNYLDILAVAPMGKVPVLKSAVDGWRGLSDYFNYYSEETIAQIADGYENMQRWLFRPDYGSVERAVIGDIEGTLLVPQAISYMVLEETMTAEEAANWLQDQVEALLANRAE
ncbi:MAG: carbohydrate ABC transporter substrate-binding protein [Anaerolineaceae bacterium]|jgi:multiple sugar transport system substrate-binding protein|nr:carbohydrate ABC transporter substrate-binding protein [Anaerolineaceae bacterium]